MTNAITPLEEALDFGWTTFQGRQVTLGTIDHQHISNNFYYMKVICNANDSHYVIEKIKLVLDHKFNGQLLPYRPHVRFVEEIKLLKEKGYLQPNGAIVYMNKIIGEIITIDDFMNKPIESATVLLFNQGKILGVSRKDNPDDFGLPGGKLEPGETHEQAAERETKEETGLKIYGLVKVFEREDLNSHNITFVAQWTGKISSQEKGKVAWITFKELKAGKFGNYNNALHFRLLELGYPT